MQNNEPHYLMDSPIINVSHKQKKKGKRQQNKQKLSSTSYYCTAKVKRKTNISQKALQKIAQDSSRAWL